MKLALQNGRAMPDPFAVLLRRAKPRGTAAIFGKTRDGKKWEPKKWQPHYEKMVALSATGCSNKYLAQQFDLTVEHVCTILNSKPALAIQKMILDKTRAKLTNSIPERFARLADASIEIAEEVLIHRREQILKDSPLGLFDRSVKFLQGVGKLRADGASDTNGTGQSHTPINLSITNQQLIVMSLEKSNRAAAALLAKASVGV